MSGPFSEIIALFKAMLNDIISGFKD